MKKTFLSILAAIMVMSVMIVTVIAAGNLPTVKISLTANQGVARADYTIATTKSCEFTGHNDKDSAHRVYLVPKYCLVGESWTDIGSKKKLMDAGASIAAGELKITNPKSPQEVHWSVELNVQYLFTGCTANAQAAIS